MATPTNQVKKETTTHPHTRLAGPAYCRLEPNRGVIPVNKVIVENDIANVLKSVCNLQEYKIHSHIFTKTWEITKNQNFWKKFYTISLLSSCL